MDVHVRLPGVLVHSSSHFGVMLDLWALFFCFPGIHSEAIHPAEAGADQLWESCAKWAINIQMMMLGGNSTSHAKIICIACGIEGRNGQDTWKRSHERQAFRYLRKTVIL